MKKSLEIETNISKLNLHVRLQKKKSIIGFDA